MTKYGFPRAIDVIVLHGRDGELDYFARNVFGLHVPLFTMDHEDLVMAEAADRITKEKPCTSSG